MAGTPMLLEESGANEDSPPRLPVRQTALWSRIRTRIIWPESVVATLARLLKKIYEVDPLRCPHCGQKMQIIAFLQEAGVIRKILRHLGLWELPKRSPPPPLFPHKLEVFLAALTPQQVQRFRAGTDSLFWDDVPIFHG